MLNDLTLDAKDAILGTQSKMSDQLIADNVVDLLYIDSKGFDKYNASHHNIKIFEMPVVKLGFRF